ncbi:MAG: type I-E CRISPR-associated endonuclease Cas1, partial [Candidatus Lokiarchaeota archaeon]|nr:type I-E CRISPR-associated endonuclease Cas1 [Candidatus Lokiarchaeota archaeon]
MRDLHELPKFQDGTSYLYVEHCKVEQDKLSVALFDKEGKVQVPCAGLAVLMLGPGTSISHAAVRSLAENGVLVLWAGEEGIRLYAQGFGKTRSAHNIMKQARLSSYPETRLRVVERMYRLRFTEPVPDGLSIQQLRGMEGARVRAAYAKAAKDAGIPWGGR